jgi:hypothetical protein
MWDTYNVLVKGQSFKEVCYIYTGMEFMKMCEEENKAAYQQQMFYSHLKSI